MVVCIVGIRDPFHGLCLLMHRFTITHDFLSNKCAVRQIVKPYGLWNWICDRYRDRLLYIFHFVPLLVCCVHLLLLLLFFFPAHFMFSMQFGDVCVLHSQEN